jgi:hypothetical protein
MKFLITLICLISSFINLKAQIDSTTNIYIHDVGLTFDYQFKQKELTGSPYTTLKYRKHSTELGPILTILKEDQFRVSLNGVRWRYAYNIYTLSKKFDIFLQTTFIYQLSRTKGEGEYFDLSSSSFKPYTFTNSIREVEVYLGYSLNYYFGKKIKLTHSLSYGLVSTNQKSNNEINGFNEEHNESSGSLIGSLGIAYILRK